MKRTLLGATLAVLAATPVSAALPATNNVVYEVEAVDKSGRLVASCVVVADRWTDDYGPTHVTLVAQAGQPASYTTARCTVTKNGTTYVDASVWSSDSSAVLLNDRNGTIPASGNRICVYAESQFLVDVRPTVSACING